MQQPTSRQCTSCKMIRLPEREIAVKDGKTWIIYTCRICKTKDIEEHIEPRIKKDR
jgi:hypothetical protein